MELRQKETDELAEKVRVLLGDEQKSFLDTHGGPVAGAGGFARSSRRALPGSCRASGGGIASGLRWIRMALWFRPRASGRIRCGNAGFLRQNAAFLGNQAAAEVYQPNAKFSYQEVQKKPRLQRRRVVSAESASLSQAKSLVSRE